MALDWNCENGKKAKPAHWSGWPGGQRIKINLKKIKIKIKIK
jgi:hypothetical protein